MATIPIRVFPDSILRRKAKRVRMVDGSIHKLIGQMIETMHAAPGVGLAAPQVGISLRVIVFGIPGEEDNVLINPEIVRTKGEHLVEEGCLSLPGYMGQIKRAESVTVKGLDQNGKEIRIRVDGLLAQILQHEIDHLNGILYFDHLESTEKLQKIRPEETGL